MLPRNLFCIVFDNCLCKNMGKMKKVVGQDPFSHCLTEVRNGSGSGKGIKSGVEFQISQDFRYPWQQTAFASHVSDQRKGIDALLNGFLCCWIDWIGKQLRWVIHCSSICHHLIPVNREVVRFANDSGRNHRAAPQASRSAVVEKCSNIAAEVCSRSPLQVPPQVFDTN